MDRLFQQFNRFQSLISRMNTIAGNINSRHRIAQEEYMDKERKNGSGLPSDDRA